MDTITRKEAVGILMLSPFYWRMTVTQRIILVNEMLGDWELDLSQCMRSTGTEFDGIIGVSNNTAIGVNISSCGDMCKLTVC